MSAVALDPKSRLENVIPFPGYSSTEQRYTYAHEALMELVIRERTEEHGPSGAYRFKEAEFKFTGSTSQISQIVGPKFPYFRTDAPRPSGVEYPVFSSHQIGVHDTVRPETAPERSSVPANSSSDRANALLIALNDLLAITRDWKSTNERRLDVIRKKNTNQITAEEIQEFQHLQELAGAKRQLVSPLPLQELAVIEADLRRNGLWRGV